MNPSLRSDGGARRFDHASLVIPSPNECRAHSLVASIDTFLKAVDKMSGTIMVPSRLKDVELSADADPSVSGGGGCLTLATRPNGTAGSIDWNNYHGVYRLLQVARYELVSGTSNDKSRFDDDDDDEESEESRKLVLMFRQHLEGLFGVLQLLTGAANHISTRYQDELGVSGAL